MFVKSLLSFTVAFFVLASPALAESLVIYSPQGGERKEWIEQQAAAAGHDIEILNAGGGELFDRILAERHNPQADIIFGLIDVYMSQLKTEGIFQPYTPSWAAGLDPAFVDADAMFHKFWQTPVVLAYRPDVFDSDTAPKSWTDLVDDAYKEHYAIGSLQWQTTRIYLVGMIARFMDDQGNVSDEGWDFMSKLFQNGLVTDDWDKIVRTISSAERGIDLNWWGGAQTMGDNGGYEPVIVNTEGGTPFIAEGIGIVAGTDKFDDAKAFVEWFGSPEFMASYAHEFEQAPAHPEALANSPQNVVDIVSRVQPQPINWELVAGELDGWLQKIELELK